MAEEALLFLTGRRAGRARFVRVLLDLLGDYGTPERGGFARRSRPSFCRVGVQGEVALDAAF